LLGWWLDGWPHRLPLPRPRPHHPPPPLIPTTPAPLGTEHPMRTLFALIATAGLVGCVGGIDNMPPTDNPPPDGVGGGGSGSAAAEAKALFESNVHPILGAHCQGCHTAGSPQGNITGFYSP